jgi:alkylhydroperoxidase family enzyme
MARIPYPEAPTPETAEFLVRLGSLNVNRMMSHAAPVLEGFAKLGLGILRKGKLDPALRELAILRVGVNCASEYEWHQHVGFARAVGAREAAIEAVRTGRYEELEELEQIVVAFADEICRDRGASAQTLARAQLHFDAERLVELTMTCGYYIMTAGFLKTFDIEAETTAPLGETVAARLAAQKAGAA